MSYRRIPPNTEGMVSLKVDNLTYRTTPEMLKKVVYRLYLDDSFLLRHVSQRVSLIVIPFCLSVWMSVIPRPTAYHD